MQKKFISMLGCWKLNSCEKLFVDTTTDSIYVFMFCRFTFLLQFIKDIQLKLNSSALLL